jgi:hypothetical protein
MIWLWVIPLFAWGALIVLFTIVALLPSDGRSKEEKERCRKLERPDERALL